MENNSGNPSNHPGTDAVFSDETELARKLGLTESFSIVFGRIIGSGIFRTPGAIMLVISGLVGMFFSAWIIGGIVTLLGALCYAELVAMMPRSGGPYNYLKTAYGPLWAFLRGWAMFFVSETASIAVVSLVFAEYGNGLFEYFYGYKYPRIAEFFISLGVVWTLTGVNCFGVRLSGIFQNIFGLLKLLVLFSIPLLSFTVGGNIANFSGPFFPDSFDWKSIAAMGAALRLSFFAYSGWEGATYVAEEVKNPRRNLPLSILIGIGGVMIMYLLVNAAYLYQLSPAAMIEAKKSIASRTMTLIIGGAGGAVVAGAVMLSVFGNVSTQILAKGRTWFSMARDGLFPAFLSKVHPVHKTPNNSMLAQACWAGVILLVATYAENAYEIIIDFFFFTSRTFEISTFAAVLVIRKKFPDVHRPFRVPFLPLVASLVIGVQLILMLIALIDSPAPSLMGVTLTATGLLYYYRRMSWTPLLIMGGQICLVASLTGIAILGPGAPTFLQLNFFAPALAGLTGLVILNVWMYRRYREEFHTKGLLPA